MVKKIGKGKKVFYVQSADWEGFTEAESSAEACLTILSEAIQKFKTDADISPQVLCMDLSNLHNSPEVENFEVYPSVALMADMGLREVAKA